MLFSCGNYGFNYSPVLLSCPTRPHMAFIPLTLGVPSALTASMSKTPLNKLQHFYCIFCLLPHSVAHVHEGAARRQVQAGTADSTKQAASFLGLST